jgi:2-polyprenyl-3-methyl-5-hydroxy-6-metoxy-1,4-benzoquinol methylase
MDEDVFLSREEAERVLHQTEYWHYPFELPWGRSSASKPGTEERHDQRRRHFFEPLLAVYGGTLDGKRVLDLGCCQGYWTFEAARAGAVHCLGLDSSATFIAEARALRTLFDRGTTEFRLAHLEEERWWEGLEPFDVTLFLGLFYHLLEPIAVLRRAMALTRETIVVDSVAQPRGEPLLALVRRIPEEPSTCGSGPMSNLRVRPTPAALLALLEDGGFTTAEVLPVHGPMPPEYVSGRRVSIIARR